jgi:HSP20 family molecular chaperone IbpA
MSDLRKYIANPSHVLNAKSHLRDNLFGPFESEFNRFFDDFFSVPRKPSNAGYPRVDVYERGNEFVVEFSIAGVDPADISVEIEDKPSEFRSYGSEYAKLLKVSGKMSQEFENKADANYHVKELTRKSFSRSMLLPDHLVGDPKATHKNGMLTLTWTTVSATEEAKPQVRSIPILTEESK